MQPDISKENGNGSKLKVNFWQKRERRARKVKRRRSDIAHILNLIF
jgi:hypothetical protein